MKGELKSTFTGDDRQLTRDSAIYAGAALAFRDRLVMDWNKTQQEQTMKDQKRVYCIHDAASVSLHQLT
jgi:starch phosphorylase